MPRLVFRDPPGPPSMAVVEACLPMSKGWLGETWLFETDTPPTWAWSEPPIPWDIMSDHRGSWMARAMRDSSIWL